MWSVVTGRDPRLRHFLDFDPRPEAAAAVHAGVRRCDSFRALSADTSCGVNADVVAHGFRGVDLTELCKTFLFFFVLT